MKSAAVTIVALVLLATVVTGREREPAAAAEPVRAAYAPSFDPSVLSRERKDADIPEIFSVPPPPPPPVAPAPKAEQAPSAPPLPFSYLGRMKKAGHTTLYLLRNQEMLIVEEGATLEGGYRVARISETAAQFVYLPLGTEQTLAIPPEP